MEDGGRCTRCHQVEQDGEGGQIDPHAFAVSVVEACRECHPEERLGRSHPVGVAPLRSAPRELPPATLPLQWSSAARAQVVTCGTCHNPHLPRLARKPVYSLQRPWGQTGQYLTYFLRMSAATSREGFIPLCHACHPGL
jgi:hypothetical protein